MTQHQDPAVVDAIVSGGRRVAVVGLSDDPAKASKAMQSMITMVKIDSEKLKQAVGA